MKKLIYFSAIVIFFSSCEKLNFDFLKKDKPCPTLSEDAVPATVVAAFQTRHAGVVVEKWFDKDGKSVVAAFELNGKDALDFFDNNGNFQKEEVDQDQQGNHQDNDDKGCDCEVED